MKVICDNCRAVYKIPDEKLVKPVNKATCRQCGHRMLIPRPRKDADPDEKTLVTAVPPTPPPAPVRQRGGPQTTPIEEESEKTLPGRDQNPDTQWVASRPVPVVGGTPEPQARRSPPKQAHTDEDTPHASSHPTPVSPSVRGNRPPPVGVPTPSPAPDAVPTVLAAAPSPSQPRDPRHDPAGDMTWALLGGVGALLGALLLALVGLLQGPLAIPEPLPLLLQFVGLAIATGGAFATILVVLTGARGRRPARPILSVVAGTVLAVVVALTPVVVRVVVDVATGASYTAAVASWMDTSATAPVAAGTPAEAEPLAPPPAVAVAADTEPDPIDDSDTEDAVADAATAEEPALDPVDEAPTETVRATPQPVAVRPPTPAARPRVTPQPTRTAPRVTPARTTPTPTPSYREDPVLSRDELDDELDLPDDPLDLGTSSKPASTASSLPERPPTMAIDVIMRNNVEIKKCFFYYQKDNGTLPKQVDVKFTIAPSGAASGASVTQSKYAGTTLDSCLGRAVAGIQFPPSQKGETVTFPFVL